MNIRSIFEVEYLTAMGVILLTGLIAWGVIEHRESVRKQEQAKQAQEQFIRYWGKVFSTVVK